VTGQPRGMIIVNEGPWTVSRRPLSPSHVICQRSPHVCSDQDDVLNQVDRLEGGTPTGAGGHLITLFLLFVPEAEQATGPRH